MTIRLLGCCVVAGLALLTGCDANAPTESNPDADTTGEAQPDGVYESAEAVQPLQPGAAVPAVEVQDLDGRPVDLAAAVKQQPTVLIFYRGGWCPYCNTQLGQLKTIESDLQQLGYQILALSPDRPAKLQPTMARNELTYTLLSDASMQAAKAFGIAFRVADETLKKYDEYGINLEEASGQEHHLLPVPAVFVVDTDGEIRFTHANPNYKVRLAPDKVLEAARANQ
jgi:peroxiredoxin